MAPATSSQPRSARYRPLLLVAGAVAAGIVCDRHLGGALGGRGLYVWWTVALVLIAACYALLRRRRLKYSSLALLAAFAALGAAWHHQSWNYLAENHLARSAGIQSQPVCVQAVAIGRTQWNPAPPPNPLTSVPQSSTSALEVQVTGLRNGTAWQPVSGTCRLRVAGELSGLQRGDRLLTFAQFGKPSPTLNPGQYDWAAAQRGEGRFVDLFCRVPQCVTVQGQAPTTEPIRLADNVAYWCERQINRYVGQGNSDLALAPIAWAARTPCRTTSSRCSCGLVPCICWLCRACTSGSWRCAFGCWRVLELYRSTGWQW